MNTPAANVPASELDRYHRQMLLPGFGEAGQRRLLDAKVLVLGCGALGTVIANQLARAGVGQLVIVDRDFIEMTNLQRQVLFDEADVAAGLPKAEAAARKIAGINRQVRVEAVVDDINHGNIERYALGCDLFVDGVDNFETRFLANDTAVKLGVPYVYGGAVGAMGMAYGILPHTPAGDRPWERAGAATPCLRCVFEQIPPPGMNPTCDTAGVLAPTVSIIASYQVNEALKILTGNWSAVSPSLLHIDTWMNHYRQLRVAKAYDLGDCVCCKGRQFEFLEGQFASSATTLCGRNSVQLTHAQSGRKMDFEALAARLRPHGPVTYNKFLLRAELAERGETYEITLFTDGRAIIKGATDGAVARSLYAKYIGA